ncbi:nicotinamide-nucleotide adenylyltransferase [Candidatus Peregrinibacteria bacterium]|nr:nicotinamide-nucleotide adenylyltransferase [Candidatus Peregrinibacteria bacterium]
MSSGFFIGRFQPLHLGHLSAIKQALDIVDFLYIGIGSSQYYNLPNNPFTLDERIEMINKALPANNISTDKYKIIPIPDINDNAKWTEHVHSLVPDFKIVFVGKNEIVKELFEKYDSVPVKKVKWEIDISATEIRKLMAENENWQEYLDKTTVDYLEEIGGVKRVSEL